MNSSINTMLDAGQKFAGVTKSYVDLSINPATSGTNCSVAKNNNIDFDAGTFKQIYDLTLTDVISVLTYGGFHFCCVCGGRATK